MIRKPLNRKLGQATRYFQLAHIKSVLLNRYLLLLDVYQSSVVGTLAFERRWSNSMLVLREKVGGVRRLEEAVFETM